MSQDEEYVKVDEYTERKVLSFGKDLMLVAVKFSGTHEDLDLHSHPHEQITYVKEGEFEYVIEDVSHILRPGDSIAVVSNVEHGARCISGNGFLIDAFNPIREDYL